MQSLPLSLGVAVSLRAQHGAHPRYRHWSVGKNWRQQMGKLRSFIQKTTYVWTVVSVCSIFFEQTERWGGSETGLCLFVEGCWLIATLGVPDLTRLLQNLSTHGIRLQPISHQSSLGNASPSRFNHKEAVIDIIWVALAQPAL